MTMTEIEPDAVERRFRADTANHQTGNPEAAGAMVGWLLGHGVDFNHPSGAGARTTLSLHESGTRAEPGWWVIRRRDGWTFALPSDRFTEGYKPVEG